MLNGAWYVICTVKLVEENPMYAGLAQENGFGAPHNFAHCSGLVKGTAAVCTCRKECRKECNKYDLTAAAHCS